MKEGKFDFEAFKFEAIKKLKAGKGLSGSNSGDHGSSPLLVESRELIIISWVLS